MDWLWHVVGMFLEVLEDLREPDVVREWNVNGKFLCSIERDIYLIASIQNKMIVLTIELLLALNYYNTQCHVLYKSFISN